MEINNIYDNINLTFFFGHIQNHELKIVILQDITNLVMSTCRF